MITAGLISKSSTEDGKKIATNIVSTITEKNQIFSYGVKALQSLIILSFIIKTSVIYYILFACFLQTFSTQIRKKVLLYIRGNFYDKR